MVCKNILSALLLSLLLVLFSGKDAYAQGGTCAQFKNFQTQFNINLLVPDPVFDTTKTAKYIDRNHERMMMRWLDAEGLKLMWAVNDLDYAGFAMGAWATSFDASFDTRAVDSYGAYFCNYVKEVTIDILYRSLIFIPTEFGQGSCRFQVAGSHAMKHFDVSKVVIDQYVALMKSDLTGIVAELESSGYVSKDKIKESKEKKDKRLRDAAQLYLVDSMVKDIAKQHTAMDSDDGILALAQEMDACGGGKKKSIFSIFGD